MRDHLACLPPLELAELSGAVLGSKTQAIFVVGCARLALAGMRVSVLCVGLLLSALAEEEACSATPGEDGEKSEWCASRFAKECAHPI